MLKCTKFDFGWGSAPDPIEEAHIQYSPRPPIAGFKGILLPRAGQGKEDGLGRGKEKEKGTGEGERGRREGREAWGGKRREGEWIEGINLPHGRLKTLAALFLLAHSQQTIGKLLHSAMETAPACQLFHLQHADVLSLPYCQQVSSEIPRDLSPAVSACETCRSRQNCEHHKLSIFNI